MGVVSKDTERESVKDYIWLKTCQGKIYVDIDNSNLGPGVFHQGQGYQQPITFKGGRGQVEIEIVYLYLKPCI